MKFKGVGILLAYILIGFVDRGQQVDDMIYFLGEAVCFLLLSIFIFINSDRYVQLIATFMVVCHISNVLDEIFFDAWKFSWERYFLAGLTAIFCIFQAIKLYLKENSLKINFKSGFIPILTKLN